MPQCAMSMGRHLIFVREYPKINSKKIYGIGVFGENCGSRKKEKRGLFRFHAFILSMLQRDNFSIANQFQKGSRHGRSHGSST